MNNQLEQLNELVVVEEGQAHLVKEVAYQLAMAEMQIKQIKEFQDEYKAKIKAEMEAKGIEKIDNEFINITYYSEALKESLDTKLLKEEAPDIYKQYLKASVQSPYIKIKCKLENSK